MFFSVNYNIFVENHFVFVEKVNIATGVSNDHEKNSQLRDSKTARLMTSVILRMRFKFSNPEVVKKLYQYWLSVLKVVML